MNNLYIAVVLTIVLGGCSSASTIQKVSNSKSAFDDAVFSGETNIVDDSTSDKDAYRVFHQAATGFVSIQSIRVSSEKRASDFCKNKGKVMHVLRERTSKPPHVLGNFPRIEIIFSCVNSAIAAPSSPVSAVTPTSPSVDKYDQLGKLKSLLDDGTITTEEFKAEKIKLLAK